MNALEVKNLHKNFAQKKIVDDLSFTIGSGQFFSLLGPSGCGKTTTLRMIAGLEKSDAGTITLQGRAVNAPQLFIPPEERELGMVFQSYALWPHMNVTENILYPLKIRKKTSAEKKQALERMLHLVHLEGLENRYPHELSGGQQQRVALARALSFGPKLVLMDEPLSNLDAKLRLELRREMKSWQKELGVTVIYVTHDHQEAFDLSDQIALMNQGRIEFMGTPEDIKKNKDLPFIRDFIFSLQDH